MSGCEWLPHSEIWRVQDAQGQLLNVAVGVRNCSAMSSQRKYQDAINRGLEALSQAEYAIVNDDEALTKKNVSFVYQTAWDLTQEIHSHECNESR